MFNKRNGHLHTGHELRLLVPLLLALLAFGCSDSGKISGNDAGDQDDSGTQADGDGAPQIDGGDSIEDGGDLLDGGADAPGDDSDPCPGWFSMDIGSVGIPGSLRCEQGVFTISASGTDVWGASDEFHYVFQPLAGDGWIAVRVVSSDALEPWAKAGVMIRESLGPDSKHANMLISNSPDKPVKFDYRTEIGGLTTGNSGSMVAAPFWVMLVRYGDLLRGYESLDGETWSRVGSQNVAMSNDAHIGLSFHSHDNGVLATAEFDNAIVISGSAPECVVRLDCDDGNVCTADTCLPVGLCEQVNNTAPCPAGTCQDGECVVDVDPDRFPPEGPLSAYTVPGQPKPAYLDSYIDANFGTKVTRVTDRVVFGVNSEHVTHHYSKTQPWNSDGSLIYIDSGRTLLSGTTYEKVGNISMSGERRWSNTTPLVMWNVDINAKQLNRIDLIPGSPYTSTSSTLHAFAEFDALYMGPWEGNQDDNDRYMAMLARTGTSATGLVWDLESNTEVSRMALPQEFDSIDWISISPSGTYVIVQTDGDGTDIYNRDFTGYRKLIPGDGHADLGYDAAGKECLVHGHWLPWPIHVQIWSTPLDGSEPTVHFNNTLYRDWSGDHVSMRARGRPGWATLSVNENETGANQIEKHAFSLRLDGSGIVAGEERVNQWVHTYTSNTEYDRNAFAVPNRDGTKIMFASDWGDPAGENNSYIVEMP